ncbi:hypothetical protein evm_010283 [Chilo suppressalis]|nr:hypothetical protein evm_010283 [Chilo suppressalis]
MAHMVNLVVTGEETEIEINMSITEADWLLAAQMQDPSIQHYKGGAKEVELYPLPKHAQPFHTLHLDHLGPFVETKNKNKYLLVMVDAFTKFVFILPIRSTKTSCTIKELEIVSKTFGNPKRLITDAGTAFTSKEFSQYCTDRNIRLHAVATEANRHRERGPSYRCLGPPGKEPPHYASRVKEHCLLHQALDPVTQLESPQMTEALSYQAINRHNYRHNDSRVNIPHGDNLISQVKIFYLINYLGFHEVLVMREENPITGFVGVVVNC